MKKHEVDHVLRAAGRITHEKQFIIDPVDERTATLALPHVGCMLGRDSRHAELACAVIAGAALPLSVEDLESARAG